MKIIFNILFLFSLKFYFSQINYLEEKQRFINEYVSDLKFDFNTYNDSTFLNYRKNLNFELNPLLEFASENSNFIYKNGLSTHFYTNFKHIFEFHFQYKIGVINRKDVPYESVLQAKSFFLHQLSGNNYLFQDIQSRIIWKPKKFAEFHVGIDKHKIGQGERSLLQDNQGVSNPFALLKLKFWKFEYFVLQQLLREKNMQKFTPKGNTSHYLNFRLNKKFSIGFFENVTHNIKDTLYNRGFEVEYLNPFIFYRPQEYANGSSDNVNLGLNTHLTFKNIQFYGQLILDEFLMVHLRNRTRWQHNKYGGQIGFKTWFKLFSNETFIRSEINIIRPYTYSHVSNSTNYGNQGLPMAHPLGSNFIESYNELFMRTKLVDITCWTQFYLKGNDIPGDPYSYGGDIYQSYGNKPAGKDFGYYIGNGLKNRRIQLGIHVSKLITKYKYNVFLEPRVIIENKNSVTKSTLFFTFGVKSRLINEKRNY